MSGESGEGYLDILENLRVEEEADENGSESVKEIIYLLLIIYDSANNL